MIAVHQNVNMFIRRAMKCSEGSIWSGFAVSDYDIQICGGGTVCPNATYRQFKAAIGDPIYNGRFVRIEVNERSKMLRTCSNARFGEVAQQHRELA